MTLRLDPHAAATIVANHHDAADALKDVGPPPSVDAGEATGEVQRLLAAFDQVGETIVQVNEIVANHVREATHNVEDTDNAIAWGFTIAARQLP
jgi:hypothetical protein